MKRNGRCSIQGRFFRLNWPFSNSYDFIGWRSLLKLLSFFSFFIIKRAFDGKIAWTLKTTIQETFSYSMLFNAKVSNAEERCCKLYSMVNWWHSPYKKGVKKVLFFISSSFLFSSLLNFYTVKLRNSYWIKIHQKNQSPIHSHKVVWVSTLKNIINLIQNDKLTIKLLH